MRTLWRNLVSLAPLACLLACGEGGAPRELPGKAGGAQPWFVEVARESGLDFTHVRAFEQRFWFPEIMGSGLAWIDFDKDGDLDLYVVQSGDLSPGGREPPGNRLFRNEGGGRFVDVTEEAGVGDRGYGMGVAVGDFDGDGLPDLYVLNVGPNVLYRNRGDGAFEEATERAGVGDPGWGVCAGFFDCDGDGDQDLFVVNYVRWSPERELECRSSWGERDYCAPNNYDAPARSILYRNEGGRFVEVSESAGLSRAFGNGLGLALVDFDRDGRLDAYVSNDGQPNQLWRNLGECRFSDGALLAGAAVNRDGRAEASMGTVPADVDQDGWVDLFITNLRNETNVLYLNRGGVFTDRTPAAGLSLASLRYTGFGDGLFDFDLDGQLDLYVVNGRVGTWRPAFREDDPYAEPNQLFRGLGGARFEELTPRGGTATELVGNSRGAAFADYDDDGDVDLAYLENHGPLRLLRNEAPRRGSWIQVRCLDERGADVPGAALELRAGDSVRHGTVVLTASYASSNDPRVHFGLPRGARADLLLVRWPGGAREAFGPLEAERTHLVRRGAGREPAGR